MDSTEKCSQCQHPKKYLQVEEKFIHNHEKYVIISRSRNNRDERISGERVSPSVVPNSLQPHRLQPARLLIPWNFPGRNTGVGGHFLLQETFPTQGSRVSCIAGRFFTIRATREAPEQVNKDFKSSSKYFKNSKANINMKIRTKSYNRKQN